MAMYSIITNFTRNLYDSIPVRNPVAKKIIFYYSLWTLGWTSVGCAYGAYEWGVWRWSRQNKKTKHKELELITNIMIDSGVFLYKTGIRGIQLGVYAFGSPILVPMEINNEKLK